VKSPAGKTFTAICEEQRLRLSRHFHPVDFEMHKEKEMADFRKWILVLAVVALFAPLASAQSSINCLTSGGVPLIVRAEGTAELTGDVVLSCTGGQGVNTFPINFQIFLNTDITSRLLTSNTTNGAGYTEALLIVDEPLSSAGIVHVPGVDPLTEGANVFRGTLGAGGQNLQWNGVPFTPPGTAGGTRTLRFTNIRANATKIPSAGIPNPITAYISVSSPTAITLSSNQVNVAQPQQSYSFSIIGSANALQCLGQSLSNGFQYAVKFTELFASAFKPAVAAGQHDSVLPPSTSFHSESGYRGTPTGSETGVATSGTRFLVQFNNPQSGVTINVSNTNINGVIAPDSAGAGVANTLAAQFVGTADINGAGGTPGTAPTSATGIVCGGNSGGCKDAWIASPLARPTAYNTLTVNANGSAYATWEVTASNQSNPESAIFGVNYSYSPALPNSPALGSSGVLGNLAPAYTLPTGTTASATLPVPRFALNATGGNTFTINPCVTDLLFPFVASTASYDTGIVVANTTADPFGTSSQSGTCTIWYYGAGAPPSQVSTSVPAGSLLAFSLQNGGSNGVTGVGFFTGYMVVQCRFQFAHGFANISDPGLRNWASGYMALVMDTAASPSVNRGSNANGNPSGTIRETLTQ
jgi:hypothetical protein